MNTNYAKSILYAYPNLLEIMSQIDELVERKALSSINDISPAISQCNAILSYTEQKDVLIVLKVVVDTILNKFNQEDLVCLDYKYFKRHKREYYERFDTSSRAYFRRQIRIAQRFAELLEKKNINDNWFETYCLKIDFFKELLKRVIEHETLSRKNKTLKEKEMIHTCKFKNVKVKTSA